MTQTEHQARVLVVDDDSLARKKFSAALKPFDVTTIAVASGQEALDCLRTDAFDLVLLDMLMPEMSGLDVLADMQGDASLREIPVLVISGLDSTSHVVSAIELGAVDFLPKNVEPQIFRARVLGCLEKKRLRDQERGYLEHVSELTAAAHDLRAGSIEPDQIALSKVAARADGLGNLARVFVELTAAIHAREAKARNRINLLQGVLLLLVMGVAWGLVPALSKLLVAPASLSPVGVAAWVALVTLGCAGGLLLATRQRVGLTASALRFGLITGLFAGVLPQTALFWVSGHVPGAVLSITLALESLIVFAIAATLRMERPSLSRLLGLLTGLVAVIVIISTSDQSEEARAPLWVLAGLIVPFSYAVESILVASMPDTENRSPAQLLFYIMLGSSIWGWGAALLTGSVLNPFAAELQTVILIVSIGVLSAISNGSYVLTIRKMGAVFASQYAYVVTIMGVGWSVVLLDERLSVWIWIALGCVLFGIFMVRPKAQKVKFSEMLKHEPPATAPNRDSAA